MAVPRRGRVRHDLANRPVEATGLRHSLRGTLRLPCYGLPNRLSSTKKRPNVWLCLKAAAAVVCRTWFL